MTVSNLRGLVFPDRRYRHRRTGRHCVVREVYRLDGIWMVEFQYDHRKAVTRMTIKGFVTVFLLLEPVATSSPSSSRGGDAVSD